MAKQPLEITIADFTQAVGMFVRRLRTAAAAHELSLTEASVLGRLVRDGAATTAELARAEGIKPQSMGTTIAALEELGLVARRPHPTDGRQVNIEVTAKGSAMRKGIGDAKRTWVAQAIATLDDEERETVFAAGRIMRRLVERDH